MQSKLLYEPTPKKVAQKGDKAAGYVRNYLEEVSNPIPTKIICEENAVREKKLEVLLKKFLSLDEYQATMGDIKLGVKNNFSGPCDQIYKVAEEILALFNIALNIVPSITDDSAIHIVAIKDNKYIRMHLAILIPEICKFPYTLYKKLGIRMISFCYGAYLLQPHFKIMFAKKRFNGLFIVEMDNTPERIIKHFHRVLCYYLVNYKKNFYKEWKALNPPDFKYGETKLKAKGLKNFLDLDCTESAFTDQSEIFSFLIKDPSAVWMHPDDGIRAKLRKLKELMEEIDGEGITFDFWEKLKHVETNLFIPLNAFEK